jgi:hypothetical protein
MNDLQHPDAAAAVEDYLARIVAQLPGPADARAAVAEELRDGLLETLETRQGRGRPPPEATAAAIAEFGDPATVAAGFAPELGALQARRVALGLLATGPLVGLTWIAAAAVNALPPWRHQLTGPWLALPLVGLALVVAVPALWLTVASTGRLGVRLRRRASFPPTAAAVAGLAAMVADLTLLAIITDQVLTAARPSVWGLVLVAVGASLSRVLLAARAARRCLAARATLT